MSLKIINLFSNQLLVATSDKALQESFIMLSNQKRESNEELRVFHKSPKSLLSKTSS
jgi:hypothetical protein